MTSAAPIPMIRRFEPHDLDNGVRIWNESVARGESTFGPRNISVEELRAELFDAPPPFESYVCDQGNGVPVAGWAALLRHTHRDIYDTVAELTVFVAAEHRGRGIGNTLVQHALARASELGFRVLLLIVQPEPAFVLAWAVRLGFRRVSGLSGVLPVGERWQDIMVFEKSIEGAR